MSNFKDKIMDFWFSTPYCKHNQTKYHSIARQKFNFDKMGDMTLVTTNCLGGEIYHALGLKFTSPFINISLNRNQFVALACNFKEYMTCEPRFTNNNERGEAVIVLSNDVLQPIEIAFPHSHNTNEIIGTFKKRRDRINYNNLVFVCDDIGLSKENFEKFNNIDGCKKILLTAKDYSSKYKCCYQLKQYSDRNVVGGYQYKTKDGLFVFEKIWDYVSCLNNLA